MPVPADKEASRRRALAEVRQHRCIYNGVLRRKTVFATMPFRHFQNFCIEWNYIGDSQQSHTYPFQVFIFFFNASGQNFYNIIKSGELFLMHCGSGYHFEFFIERSCYFLAISLPSCERFVRFGKAVSGHDKPCLAFFAPVQNALATFPLLLLQGNFKHKIGFDINVHTTASYSMRPSLAAAGSPDSTSHAGMQSSSPGASADRMILLSQAETTISNAGPLMRPGSAPIPWK